MDSAEKRMLGRAGSGKMRLFQPVAVSASKFPPRLSQPVEGNDSDDDGNSDDDDGDGGGGYRFRTFCFMTVWGTQQWHSILLAGRCAYRTPSWFSRFGGCLSRFAVRPLRHLLKFH